MSTFTQRLYRDWLRSNGSALAAAASAAPRLPGYGAKPHVHLSPITYPAQGAGRSLEAGPLLPAGVPVTPAPSLPVHGAAARRGALPEQGTASPACHEKPVLDLRGSAPVPQKKTGA